jgi:hypothetical protein
MDKFFIEIYKNQILEQVALAEKAYTEILKNETNPDLLFEHLHHFVVHVSNVMKLIQPNAKEDTDFRKYRAIQLKKAFPLLPEIDPRDVNVRNDFEHFDERIDWWVINSKRHNYADKNIMPVGAMRGIDPKDNFRQYDPETKILYFAGREYHIVRLYEYIQKVKSALEQNYAEDKFTT